MVEGAQKKRPPYLVLCIFISMAIVTWFYVLWITYQPDILMNAWSAVVPLMTYFYATFALIAAIGMFTYKQFGLTLAYGVLMAGMLSSAISYNLAFRSEANVASLFILVIILNICTVIYLTSKKQLFISD